MLKCALFSILSIFSIAVLADNWPRTLSTAQINSLLDFYDFGSHNISDTESYLYKSGKITAAIYGKPKISYNSICKMTYVVAHGEINNGDIVSLTPKEYVQKLYLVWLPSNRPNQNCDILDKNQAIQLSNPIEEKTLQSFHKIRHEIVARAISEESFEIKKSYLDNISLTSVDVRDHNDTWVYEVNYNLHECLGVSVYLEPTEDKDYHLIKSFKILC
jgi:hypothetical protein